MSEFFNPANWWLWIIGALTIGIFITKIIPDILKRFWTSCWAIIFNCYFGSRTAYELTKEKLFEEAKQIMQNKK